MFGRLLNVALKIKLPRQKVKAPHKSILKTNSATVFMLDIHFWVKDKLETT